MNLLIVDDSISVVDGLRENIDWAKIGITQTFGAYSAFEARLIIGMHPIDILLSDIEMPLEDGLSLVTWVREQKLDICVILLTAHAKFSYAQQSLKLDAFDYILQPSPYHEIAAAVGRAVEKVKQDKLSREMSEYGEKYVQSREAILAAAFLGQLTGAATSGSIRELAEQGGLPKAEQSVAVGLLDLLKPREWQESLQPRLTQMLREVLSRLAFPLKWNNRLVSTGSGLFGLAVWSDSEIREDALQRQMMLLLQGCLQQLGTTPAVWIAHPDTTTHMHEIWTRLNDERTRCEKKVPGLFWLSEKLSPDGKNGDMELIGKINEYIDRHMEDAIHRTDLAEALFLNPDYLNRLVKQETGKTVKEYILERKLQMARRLLTTTRLPVNLIAARVGFTQLSHFSATYKKAFDLSPMQERKEGNE